MENQDTLTIKIKNNNNFQSTANIGWALERNKECCGIPDGVDVKIREDLSYSYFLELIHNNPINVQMSCSNNNKLTFKYIDDGGQPNNIIPRYNDESFTMNGKSYFAVTLEPNEEFEINLSYKK